MEKVCTKCNQTKKIELFSSDRSKSDGRCSYCKECSSIQNKKWRISNSERVKQYFRDRYTNNPGICIDRVREWRRANPEKKERQNALWIKNHPTEYTAHNILNAAVRDGKIKKPSSCSICNGSDKNVQAHHEDYTKPLDVIWLCAKCHTALHLGKGGDKWQYVTES